MDDDAPFYAPNRKPRAPGQQTPGFKQWQMGNGQKVARCEFRDDEKAAAGVDVVLMEDGELLISKRCLTLDAARYVANAWKQD